MPATFVEFRVRCGMYNLTVFSRLSKKRKRDVTRSKEMRFVPHGFDLNSKGQRKMYTDLPMFFFLSPCFTRDAPPCAKARFGLVTASFLAVFLARFLLQCMDVEANPGPVQNTGNLRRTLFSMAGYPKHHDTEHSERRLEDWCQDLQEHNEKLREDVQYLSGQCSTLQQQCDDLFQWRDTFLDVAQKMDSQVDKIESFSRRNNVRFFNVHEGPQEDNSQCTRMVVQLLNRFFGTKNWTTDDLERAHRLGRKSTNRPRPIIAHFHRWQDKLSILKARDCRVEMASTLGIRVSSDLTDRQNHILREERNAGRQAYVWKGRLCYSNRNTHQQRYTRNGSSTYSPNSSRTWNVKRDSRVLQGQSYQLGEIDDSASQQGIFQSQTPVTSPPAQDSLPEMPQQQSPRTDPDLPWTADMNIFPSLRSRKPYESPTTANKRETRKKKGATQGHLIPQPTHEPMPTADDSIANAASAESQPSVSPADSAAPQHTPLAQSYRVVDKWGVRLVSPPDCDEVSQSPCSSPDNEADQMAPQSSPGPAESGNQPSRQSVNCTEAAPSSSSSNTPCDQDTQSTWHDSDGPGAVPSAPTDLPPPPFPTVPSTLPSPVASSPDGSRTDSSQTQVKRLPDPWGPSLLELESQSPVHPPAEEAGKKGQRRGQRRAVKPDQQNISVVSETPSSRSRWTRSKAQSRQTHVTDCFPRLNNTSVRNGNDDHIES